VKPSHTAQASTVASLSRPWPCFLYLHYSAARPRWRRDGATQQRLEIAGHGSGDHVRPFRAPDYLLAEREALAVAREQRALTGYFCGDPPAGYSALHGKTGLR
jgi:hypothetical protein